MQLVTTCEKGPGWIHFAQKCWSDRYKLSGMGIEGKTLTFCGPSRQFNRSCLWSMSASLHDVNVIKASLGIIWHDWSLNVRLINVHASTKTRITFRGKDQMDRFVKRASTVQTKLLDLQRVYKILQTNVPWNRKSTLDNSVVGMSRKQCS